MIWDFTDPEMIEAEPEFNKLLGPWQLAIVDDLAGDARVFPCVTEGDKLPIMAATLREARDIADTLKGHGDRLVKAGCDAWLAQGETLEGRSWFIVAKSSKSGDEAEYIQLVQLLPVAAA